MFIIKIMPLIVLGFLEIFCTKPIDHVILATVGSTQVTSYNFIDSYSNRLLNTQLQDSKHERDRHLNELIRTKLFAEASGNSNAYTKGTWFQTLGNKIQSVSNAIHQKTLRGGANFIVVSPETATIIESIPGYAADTDGDATNTSYAMGVQKVGQLNNRYTVYKNPYMIENQILVGFRGSNFLETGAVYAPYVPLIMTPLVYDPTNFTPRKGVMTRYAKKMVRPEFYGKVIVADVNYV